MNPFDAITQKYKDAAPQAAMPMNTSTPTEDNNPFSAITNKYASAVPDIQAAKKELGQQGFNGLCQAFVEQVTSGKQGQYPSAIDAWNAQQNIAKQGFQGVEPGDPLYFTPNDSNQGYGHTGIYLGNNQFVSATDNGIQQQDLNDWYKATGQHVMGYIPKGKMQNESN